jgi:chorismate mutase
VTVLAIRGATQVGANDSAEILAATGELVAEVLLRNGLSPREVISVLFTTTPDLTAAFPATAARRAGFQDVPLMCATEIAVPGAPERIVRLMAHVDVERPRSAVRHVYLRGAAVLRADLTS